MREVYEPSYLWDKHGFHWLHGSHDNDPELRQHQRDKSMAKYNANLINNAIKEHSARTESALAANRHTIALGNALLAQNLSSLEKTLSQEIFEIRNKQDKTNNFLNEIRELVGISAVELERIEHFEQAEKYFKVAKENWELEMFQAAKQEYQQAIAINRNDYWSLKELGFIYLYVDGFTDTEQAIKLYSLALLAARADSLSDDDRIRYSKHTKPTEDELRLVIDECNATLAFANFRLGNFEKAIEFQQSLLKNTKSWFGYIQLARYMVASGAHDEAFTACAKAIDLEPEKFELISGFEDLANSSRIREGLDGLYQGMLGNLTDLFTRLEKVQSTSLQGQLIQIRQQLQTLTYAQLRASIVMCEDLIANIKLAEHKLVEIERLLHDIEHTTGITNYWSDINLRIPNDASIGVKSVISEINELINALAKQTATSDWREDSSHLSMEQKLSSLKWGFQIIKKQRQAAEEIFKAYNFLPIWVKLDPENLEALERSLENYNRQKTSIIQESTVKNRNRTHRRFNIFFMMLTFSIWVALDPTNAKYLFYALWPNTLIPYLLDPISESYTFKYLWIWRMGPFSSGFIVCAIFMLSIGFPNNPLSRMFRGKKKFYYPNGFQNPEAPSKDGDIVNAEFNKRNPFWAQEEKRIIDQIIGLKSLLSLRSWVQKDSELKDILSSKKHNLTFKNWQIFQSKISELQDECNQFIKSKVTHR
jgi:tetratricopeptide (TPR) repeat protein